MQIKPATSCTQQVALIHQKGFQIDDDPACEQFFKRHNYYRVSAYLLPYKKSDGTYLQGLNYEKVQNTYYFDSAMRKFLYGVIEQIELYCRTLFSDVFVANHGALGYMDGTQYSSAHQHGKFLQNIQRFIQENQKSPIVVHHQSQYGGDFPLWVIIELFSFGSLSYFYSDMQSQDQKAIAHELSTSVACLKSWMRCITDLRNRCAHYSRLYYWKFTAVPKMPNTTTFVADHRLFSQILMLSYVYPDKAEWNGIVMPELKSIIQKYAADISYAHIGFPANWETLLVR